MDDEDYEFLINCYNLYRSGNYVVCKLKAKYKNMGLYDGLQLQKLLMNPEKTGRSINVDHRDGNEDNYQKNNLRVCTHQENSRNRKISIDKYINGEKSSKYKGVSWCSVRLLWQAYIRDKNRTNKLIGLFKDEEAAANAYNYYAIIYHDEYAKLNEVTVSMDKKTWESYLIKKNKSSKFKGVSFVDEKWLAQIYHKGKNIRIGFFDTEIEAAIAYNDEAIELKGNKAKLNIIEGGDN